MDNIVDLCESIVIFAPKNTEESYVKKAIDLAINKYGSHCLYSDIDLSKVTKEIITDYLKKGNKKYIVDDLGYHFRVKYQGNKKDAIFIATLCYFNESAILEDLKDTNEIEGLILSNF